MNNEQLFIVFRFNNGIEVTFLFYFLKILFIYFFRERGREGEREGGKH